MSLATDALNHLLRQNSWAAEHLRPYAGKVVRLTLAPLELALLIDAAGEFTPAPDEAPPDAGVALTPASALRLRLQADAPPELMSLQGDPALATLLAEILRNLHWDTEEDLSRIVGDIPAHQLSRAGSRIASELRRQAWSVAGQFAEYWLEEQPLIAKQRHLDGFSRDIAALQADIERIAQRVKDLEQRP